MTRASSDCSHDFLRSGSLRSTDLAHSDLKAFSLSRHWIGAVSNKSPYFGVDQVERVTRTTNKCTCSRRTVGQGQYQRSSRRFNRLSLSPRPLVCKRTDDKKRTLNLIEKIKRMVYCTILNVILKRKLVLP